MLGKWCDAVVRRRKWVIGVCAAAALGAAIVGRQLFNKLGYAVFYDPAAESTRGLERARRLLGEGDPDVVALYRLPDGVDATSALAPLMQRIATRPEVTRVVGPSGPIAQRFVSEDRRSAFVVVSLRGTPRAKAAALPSLRASLDLSLPGATVHPELGGLVPSGRALTRLARDSLERGERIALPVTAVLLLVIFGSVVAALLPLAIGGLSIVFALALLELLSHAMSIDAFAVNVVTVLGLGVAIDYALFIVNRYREELARARPGELARRQALSRAVQTAGRSVLFSGITVAASLAGLLVFRQPFLRSVAAGGLLVTLLASTLALVLLPAALALLGPRLERGRLPLLGRLAAPNGPPSARWHRIASLVIRRRIVVCVGVTVFLLLLATPFRRVQPSRADVRALPASEEPRRVADAIARDFPGATLLPVSLLVELDGDLVDGDRLGQLWDYTERLRRVDGVARVDSLLSYAGATDREHAEDLAPLLERYRARAAPTPRGQPGLGAILDGSGRDTLVRVIPTAQPDSPEAQRQVAALRKVAPPEGGRVLAFGQAAALYDFASSLRTRAPWMLGTVVVAMFVVLFFAFRSVVLPVKAMLMTALSLTASFGAIVFVFQDGRLQHLLGYTVLGTTDATLPVVLFAVVFGLSMDYEVLILGRVRESYERTGSNARAVVEGLARTGRLVTSAALVMVVVFSAFAAAPVVYVKALGLGMALAVALDATVVRMLLVPSTMALLGRLNWWRPGRA